MLDFYFDFASPYSYVGAMRVEALCKEAGVRLRWRPFLLGPIFTAQQGLKDSPFNAQPVKGRYMWRDVERLCEKYGFPIKKPESFPQRSILAARVACVALEQPWCGDFIRGVFQANFAQGKDIAAPATLGDVLSSLGVDPGTIIPQAELDPVKRLLRAFTDEAMALGIFGAPNAVISHPSPSPRGPKPLGATALGATEGRGEGVANSELFFGQDRLEDAVAFARKSTVYKSPG